MKDTHMFKQITRYKIIYSLILAIGIVLMTKIHVVNNDMSLGIDSNYFKDFKATDLLLFIGVFIAAVLLCVLLDFLLTKLSSFNIVGITAITDAKSSNESSSQSLEQTTGKTSKRKVLIVWGTLILLAFTALYLSYFPGGVMSDTQGSISYYYDGVKTNRFPFLYSSFIGLVISISEKLGHGLRLSIVILAIIQMLLAMALLLYFCKWMLDRRVRLLVVNIIMAIMTFVPMFSTYVISIWKDTPFVMAFLFWYLAVIDLAGEIRNDGITKQTVIRFIIGIFLVAFTRNNGIYLLLIFFVAFLLINIKEKYIGKKRLISAFAVSLAIIAIIQGPVYDRVLDSGAGMMEHLGIPLQQVCAVVVYDGDMTDSQYEDIGYYIPHDSIREMFAPLDVDYIKWYSEINYDYFHENEIDFLKLWIKLGLCNPGIYLREYALQTCGFWDIAISEGASACYYTSNYMYTEELEQKDILDEQFGFSLRNLIDRLEWCNGALLFWLFLGIGFRLMEKRGWRGFILVAPQIALWGTLMIATPIAISFRYISPLLFTLPAGVLTMFMSNNAEKGA